MKSLCLYFKIHQPLDLKQYHFFNIGEDDYYYNDYENESKIRRIAESCYLPANKLLLELLEKHKDFRICFSISGISVDLFKQYAPDVLDSFKALANTGQVEFLAETYSHSLASLQNEEEFNSQVLKHKECMEEIFDYTPKVFCNTELIYSDKIGEWVSKLGFEAIITEGAKHIMAWKSPNFVYANATNPKLKVLLRNYELSKDIEENFSDSSWSQWPLTCEKYVQWLNDTDKKDELINIFLNYESIGETHKKESGIFDFIKHLPRLIDADKKIQFTTASQAIQELQPIAKIQVSHPISCRNEEQGIATWQGNSLQKEALSQIMNLRPLVLKINNHRIESNWKYLQASNHFEYMNNKFNSKYSTNPYKSAYDAFINYMNIVSDFKIRIKNELETKESETHQRENQLTT